MEGCLVLCYSLWKYDCRFSSFSFTFLDEVHILVQIYKLFLN